MKNQCLLQSYFLLLILFFAADLKAQSIVQLQQGKPTSIRGLSVVDDSVAWISGSKGYITITRNGGKDWTWQQVKGFEKADFRDIEAFSDKEAVIMSSGTPALILKTIDGGLNWKVKYQNPDTAYFFDAMDFADKQHGYILGDPIKNNFLLLETKDGGESWKAFSRAPKALPGEASFAASGTCFRAIESKLYIATGGSNARLLTFSPVNNSWEYLSVPITHGKSSQGAFSLAMGKDKMILIGGDYAKDKSADSILAVYGLHPFTKIDNTIKQPAVFQSCVEFIGDKVFLSTGTPGSNITTDDGKTWIKIDDTSFNVCRRAKHGKLILLAGNDGKIATLKL
jgi:photosystem II stability/assembly factor-like uncharacterized protein